MAVATLEQNLQMAKEFYHKRNQQEEAEKVNKARKEKTFERSKRAALENPKEVKEMIDKPKRGLVDEPGSYAGKENIKQNKERKARKKIFIEKRIWSRSF